MSFELVSTLDGKVFNVLGQVVRLGRASDNTIVVSDPAVSRYHINLYVKDGSLIAEDAGSQNGFLVNGKVVKESVMLTPGDHIFIGSREYLVRKPGMSSAPSFGANSGPAPGMVLGAAGGPTLRPRPALRRDTSSLKWVGGTILGLVALAMYFRTEADNSQKRTPAGTIDTTNKSLPNDGYRKDIFRQKSITEVQAEAKFRETLRDYYNGNYSRAILGFRDVLTLNPAHDDATEFLQSSETLLTKQIKTLLADGDKSYGNLQYARAKAQSMKILTIISEQIPSYGRKIAMDTLTAPESTKLPSQEENLLNVPCEKARDADICKKAVALLKKSRQVLGEEDTLK